jgi:hypothetical protein
MEKLVIKYRNQKQTFEILDEEIKVDLQTSKHKLQYNILLEDIKKTQYIVKTKQNSFTILAFFSFILNVILLFYLFSDFLEFSKNLLTSIFISISFIIVLVSKTLFEEYDEKHIDSSKLFYFIYTKKNASQVDNFINLVYQKQMEFFRKKYFFIDPVLPYNIQFERYIWLYNNKYINENEYEVIKEDLDKYFNFNPTL